VKEAASRLHSKVEPASLALKRNVAVVSVVGSVGPKSIVVSGAIVSTVHAKLAGVESVFPAASVARTSKVWLVSLRPVYTCGEVHEENVPPSSRHSKVAPASLELNVKVASVEFVGSSGDESINVCGGVASTVTVTEFELPEALPAASVAIAV